MIREKAEALLKLCLPDFESDAVSAPEQLKKDMQQSSSIDEHKEKLLASYGESLKEAFPAYKEKVLALVEEHFTEVEIDALLKFSQSPFLKIQHFFVDQNNAHVDFMNEVLKKNPAWKMMFDFVAGFVAQNTPPGSEVVTPFDSKPAEEYVPPVTEEEQAELRAMRDA